MNTEVEPSGVIAIDDAHAVTVVHRLVEIPSVSGHESRAVEQFVSYAENAGFRAEIDEVGNGIATRPAQVSTGPTRQIVLLGHIDTVAGEIPVRFERNILHGRGSVDAKGPLCAMLVAASRAIVPDDVEIVVIAAVGEETAGSPGARHVRERYRPDFCIIGEPSGWDGVTLGYKGRLLVTARHVRPAAHGAGREGSASDVVVNWWNTIRAGLDEDNASHERVFDQVQATIESMQSSRDGLTDTCVLCGGFRLPPWLSPDALEVRIQTMTPREITCAFSGGEVAHRTNRNDPVVRALTTSIRGRGGTPIPKFKTGTADLNVVGPTWQCPIAAYGPGDSSLDHTPEEHLEMTGYLRAIDVLAAALPALTEDLQMP